MNIKSTLQQYPGNRRTTYQSMICQWLIATYVHVDSMDQRSCALHPLTGIYFNVRGNFLDLSGSKLPSHSRHWKALNGLSNVELYYSVSSCFPISLLLDIKARFEEEIHHISHNILKQGNVLSLNVDSTRIKMRPILGNSSVTPSYPIKLGNWRNSTCEKESLHLAFLLHVQGGKTFIELTLQAMDGIIQKWSRFIMLLMH